MTDTRLTGLSGVPLAITPLTRKDFTSDAEVRWCPGCGDYAILAAFQGMMPTLGIARENTVIVSGIGCASRFPYYVDSYGMHSIHGRAPAIATGLAMTRPDLAVFVVTGDGDALSIGGNHLIHALRRNLNITILLFNNRIYGLTKGQFSPTSEQGKVTKSSPMGSLEVPFNPLSLAIGAEATFVARAVDSDRAGLTEVLTAAAAHRGARSWRSTRTARSSTTARTTRSRAGTPTTPSSGSSTGSRSCSPAAPRGSYGTRRPVSCRSWRWRPSGSTRSSSTTPTARTRGSRSRCRG